MWKWLRVQFAWRFSLCRLVIAVLFLGTLAHLNFSKIGPIEQYCSTFEAKTAPADGTVVLPRFQPTIYLWGWPFPFMAEREPFGESEVAQWASRTANEVKAGRKIPGGFAVLFNKRVAEEEVMLTPWTYRLVNFREAFSPESSTSVLYGLLDAVFAVAVLLLILCIQVEYRRIPETLD